MKYGGKLPCAGGNCNWKVPLIIMSLLNIKVQNEISCTGGDFVVRVIHLAYIKKITLVAVWRMDHWKTRMEAGKVAGIRSMLVELYTSRWECS